MDDNLRLKSAAGRVWSGFALVTSLALLIFFPLVFLDVFEPPRNTPEQATLVMGILGMAAVIHTITQWAVLVHRPPWREGQSIFDLFVAVLVVIEMVALVIVRMTWEEPLTNFQFWTILLFTPVILADLYIGIRTIIRFARYGSPTEISRP